MKKHKTLLRLARAILSLALAATITFSSSTAASAAYLGIDVSKYQGAIDWAAVRTLGISFAFIKAGSTASGLDPYFAANVLGAQTAGIRTGAYIYSYANSVEAAINEANMVLQWIEGYNINLPVAFDIEDKVQKELPPATVTAMCNAFGDVIAAAGYHPIICTYKNFYLNNMVPAENRYDLWIAQYAQTCDIPNAAVWQASSEGAVPGIAGNVDVDYMFKDYMNLIVPAGFTQHPDGSIYFYNNYRRQIGWVNYNNVRFHMNSTGLMDRGWFSDESGVYFLADDGHAVVGQNQIHGENFYFDELGRIAGGWVTINDKRYYYDGANGCRMATGWINVNGMYYLSPEDGHALTGYQKIDDSNYYFGADGTMKTGIITIGGGTFYFDPATGRQANGFVGDPDNRYYFNAYDGSMATGLQSIDGLIFYFGTDGRMQYGWQKVGDATYYFDPVNGTMVKGLMPQTDGVYGTSQVDGHQLVNELALVDKVPRCFDGTGRMVVNATYTIGNTTYRCDANGIATIVK